MAKPVIIGAGMVKFGRYSAAAEELAVAACHAAIADAGIALKDVNAVFCGHVAQGMTFAQRVMDRGGLAGVPAFNFENACASGATALHFASMALAAQQYDIALVFGAEKMKSGLLPLTDLMTNDLESLIGLTVPALSALSASRYASRYELAPEDLAAVVVKNRRNAALNPYAQLAERVSAREVLDAPMISTPLTRLMCCPTSDGAAAVVVASERLARRLGRNPVRILASHIEGGHLIGRHETPNATARAAKAAYERASVGPEDIDLVEGLDYTAMAEILLYEDLGFCRPGEGVDLLRAGKTGPGGRVSFSPGGGLIGRGHPLGATGVAQVVEAVWHLRGEAGTRQVPGARIALTHAAGGVITGIDDEAAVAIHLLGS